MANSSDEPIHVLLACGHGWREYRPAGLAAPVQGELRSCGHPEHYPQQFPATYGEQEEMWQIAIRIKPGQAAEVCDQIRELDGVAELYRAWEQGK